MTFTKERLTELSRRENVGAILGEEIAELARIALASLEAEPVCVIDQANLDYLKSGSDADVWPASRIEMGDVLLYRAAMLQGADGTLTNEGTRNHPEDNLDMVVHSGDANEKVEPVTTAYKLPANTPCKDAPEHIWLQTAGVWPENGEFSELTWCSDNQHKDDTLYVRADVVSGNSPVIPDGWVACSEQMPEDEQEVIVQNKMGYRYVSYFDEHSGLFFDMRGGNQMNCIEHIFVTHWMPLPAAPQQK